MTTIKTGKAALAAESSAHGLPHDPRVAGTVGHRRASYNAVPDPNGNRAARRAAAKKRRRA